MATDFNDVIGVDTNGNYIYKEGKQPESVMGITSLLNNDELMTMIETVCDCIVDLRQAGLIDPLFYKTFLQSIVDRTSGTNEEKIDFKRRILTFNLWCVIPGFEEKLNEIDVKLFWEIINTVRLIDDAMDVTDELDVYVNKLVSEKGSALEGWDSQFVKEELLKLARMAISM